MSIELVKQAYTIVVTVSDKNEIIAFKVVLRDNTSLFNVIKADPQARILEGAVTAEALLPEGPYNLWHEGETEYRVNDMEKAFAQFYRLPKMLNRKAIIETLLNGCRDGLFVLRSTRTDHSFKTFWYDAPDIAECQRSEPGGRAARRSRADRNSFQVALTGCLTGVVERC